MKYHIKTYGCQMNYSDSERIASVLEKEGYKKTAQESEADLIVINMCSVRKSAVDRIAGNFKKYKQYKKKNPDLKIVLTGCVLESDKERFEKLFDLVIDIKKIKQLSDCHPELVSGSSKNNDLTVPISSKLSVIKVGKIGGNKQKILKQACPEFAERIQNDSNDNDSYFQIQPKYQSNFSAYVPIMTGCNNFCSYCVVPYTRGREKSRPVKEIIGEITELVDNKYKEIILLGQNVNSYNKSNPTNWIPASAGMTKSVGMTRVIDFPKLLKLINNIPGNFWIRFLSSHPKDITKELIKTISECEKVTPHLHLALQSGDDEILKKMNRKYTAEHFLDLVNLIRKHIPDAAITTDIIVGFPGETEKQFQKTVEVMREAKFDMVYINKYSPRVGTASYKMKDNVSWEEKKRREKVLTEILKETALENNQKYVGKVVEVLVEKVDEDFIYGKTRSFKNVKMGIKNQELGIKEGEFLEVKITKAKFWNLEGKVVK
ncbi:MiaB/RimO family radical SAM methylthiotransferase [Candidatus Parcubacteria bacterium]|nr:MiaB/RimO family radical SAM methylthiotransferase [Candidatus Parcubacteria bacterium]